MTSSTSSKSLRMISLFNINNQEFVRNIWRLSIFVNSIVSLSFLLFENDYQLNNIKKILIEQTENTNFSQNINKNNGILITSLLGIDKREVKQKLLANLSVKDIYLNRLIQPSRMEIKFVSREPVAWAERQNVNGIEQGFVDINGQWINMDSVKKWKIEGIKTRIIGWQSFHQISISEILTSTIQYSSCLKEIHIDPDGTFWLILVGLGPLHFGRIDDHLSLRISVLKELVYHLPTKLKGRRPEFIDIGHLAQPEIGFIDETKSSYHPPRDKKFGFVDY